MFDFCLSFAGPFAPFHQRSSANCERPWRCLPRELLSIIENLILRLSVSLRFEISSTISRFDIFVTFIKYIVAHYSCIDHICYITTLIGFDLFLKLTNKSILSLIKFIIYYYVSNYLL